MINLELLLRLALAMFIGLVVGFERENHLKNAGLRTPSLVSLASALLMIVSKYAFYDVLPQGLIADPARVAAGIVSGIGFLGAGTIFMRSDNVQGLTTAAGIWATAAVGMAIGAGLYVEGILVGLFVLVLNALVRSKYYSRVFPVSRTLEAHIARSPGNLQTFKDILEKHHVEVLDIEMDRDFDLYKIHAHLKIPGSFKVAKFTEELLAEESIFHIEL